MCKVRRLNLILRGMMINSSSLSTRSSCFYYSKLKKVPSISAPYLGICISAIKSYAELEKRNLNVLSLNHQIMIEGYDFLKIGDFIGNLVLEDPKIKEKIQKVYKRFCCDSSHRFLLEEFFSNLKMFVSSKNITGLKRVLNRFFNDSTEELIIKLVKINDEYDLDLKSLLRILDPMDSNEIRKQISIIFFNYSLNSLKFLKHFLFFSFFHQEIRNSFHFPIGNFENFFEVKKSNIVAKKHWMDELLKSYPAATRCHFRQSFTGFAKEITKDDPNQFLLATVHPIFFYSVSDLASWILDPRLIIDRCINIFSTYYMDPMIYTKIFESFPTLNARETDHLIKIFNETGIIQLRNSSKARQELSQKSVLAKFLKDRDFEKIYEWMRHFFILTGLQSPLISRYFVDYLNDELFCDLFFDLGSTDFSFSEVGKKIRMSVIEFLLIADGGKIFEILHEYKKYLGAFSFRIDEWLEAIFKSSGTLLRCGLLMDFFENHQILKTDYKRNTINFHFQPIYYLFFNPKVKTDIQLLKSFVFPENLSDEKKPYNLEWLISFFFKTNLFNFINNLQKNGFALRIFHNLDLDAVKQAREQVVDLLISCKETFIEQFMLLISKRILLEQESKFLLEYIPSFYRFLSVCNQIIQEIDNKKDLNLKGLFKDFLEKTAEYSLQKAAIKETIKDFIKNELDEISGKVSLYQSLNYYLNQISLKPNTEILILTKFYCSSLERMISKQISNFFPTIPIFKIELIFELVRSTFIDLSLELSPRLFLVLDLIKNHDEVLNFIIKGEDGCDELIKIFNFNSILDWSIQNFIKNKQNDFEFFFKLSSKKLLSVEWSLEKSRNYCLFDALYFMKYFSEISDFGERALAFDDHAEFTLNAEQSKGLEKKGKIILFYEQISTPFLLSIQNGEPVKLKSEHLIEFIHRLHILNLYTEDLLKPFEVFSGSSSELSLSSFKRKIADKFKLLKGASEVLPKVLIDRIITLFDSLNEALSLLDPLGISDLIKIFDHIEFIDLEESFTMKEKIFVVSSTIFDDNSLPLSKEMLRKNFSYLIHTILSRKTHLAVPEDRIEKQKYYTHLEIKLFELKCHITKKIEDQIDLEIIGPIICNIAAAGMNCSTRWGLEIENGIDALNSSSIAHDYNSLLDRNLHSERKQIIMELLQEIYQQEVSSFGIEYIIHQYNYIRANYANILGLEPWSEWMILEEEADQVEADLIEHEFFRKFFNKLKEKLFSIATSFDQNPKFYDLMIESLFKFYLDKRSFELGEIDYLSIKMPNFYVLEKKISRFIDNLFLSYSSESSLEISENARKELSFLCVSIEHFHSLEMQTMLEENGIFSQPSLRYILYKMKDKKICKELLAAFNQHSGTILDEKIRQDFGLYLQDVLDRGQKELFVEVILNDGLIRDKFIDWDKKKTIDAAIQFERVYWKSFLFSLFKMIERKLRISGVNFLTPIEKQRFFSHWISNQEIQSFFLDSILNSKEIEKISKIEKELYLEEKASGLTEYCRQFSLISISREESISLLKKLMITSGFHYERILVDFLKKHRRESLFVLFKEVIDTRPTAKYLLLLEKLIQDGYIKTAQGKISEKLNSEFQLNFS